MPTTLTAGDIAFTAAQADNTGGAGGDFLEFILLVPVTAGTTIFFTDNGYRTDSSTFRTNENVLRWVAQTDLPAGTIRSHTAPTTAPASTAEWTGITASSGATTATAPFGLATGGDNIAALFNPTFGGTDGLTGTAIAQLTFGGSTFASTFTASSLNAHTALAPGLTDGTNAISLAGTDNVRYNGATITGTQAEIRAALTNDANWQSSTTPFTNAGANVTFTVNGQTGTAGADTLSGGNNISGLAGDDTLVAGAGNQTLDGGADTDTVSYANAAAGVIVRLNRGDAFNDGMGGVDTLVSIENATGSAFADTLVGDANANVLNGGAGRDVLVALGGNDTLIGGSGVANEMYGGTGDDTYVVSAVGDSLIEAAAEGTDLVQTTLTAYRLGSNLENLTYTGVASFAGFGNGDNNVITGGVAADTLTGGAGNDTLIGGTGAANTVIGGLGDDTYVLSANDTIIEANGEGTDTVQTDRAFHTLRANVENLTYTGAGIFQGTGNDLANVITGGAQNDTLIGGLGNDTLNGGAGTADYIVLQGTAAQYTVTDLGGGSFQIVDSVGGRDGTDTTTGVERVRFASGPTASLASLVVTPGALEPVDKTAATAQVLPGLTDDDFLMGKDSDLPLVLPSADDASLDLGLGLGLGLGLERGPATEFPLQLAPLDQDGLFAGGSDSMGGTHDRDGWLF